MMTPEEISEHFGLLDHLWALPEPERAERLARLETALATDPPEDLAMRLRALVGVFRPPRPLTRQEEIDRRFTGDHGRAASIAVARERRRRGVRDPWPSCGTYATVSVAHDYWHACAHAVLLEVAAWRAGLPAVAVAALEGRPVSDPDLGFAPWHYYDVGRFGDATATCTCPHDCAWSGPLREMWIEGGHAVCPGCHEACRVSV
jgi:hypothetical protein